MAEKKAARSRSLDEASSLQHTEEIAKNEETRLRKQVEVAEKEEERLRILLDEKELGEAARVRKSLGEDGDAEVGSSNCPLGSGSGQSCKNSHGPQSNGDSQQREMLLDKGKGPLEPLKDTPRVGEAKSTVVPHDQWPKLGEELAPDSEEPVRVAQSSSNEEGQTAQERSTPDLEEPVQVAQSSPSEEYWPAQEQSAPDAEEPIRARQSSSSEGFWSAQEEQSNCSEPSTSFESSDPIEQLGSSEPLTSVEQSPPVKPTNAVDQSLPSEPSIPAEKPAHVEHSIPDAQSSSVGQSNPAPQSNAIEQLTLIVQSFPAEQSGPDPSPPTGPPIVRLPRRCPSSEPQEQSTPSTQVAKAPGSSLATKESPATQKAQTGLHKQSRPNYRARRDAIIAERKRIGAAQEALATQLNPAAQSFTATPVVEAAQSVPAKRLNPAAPSFEATQAAEAAPLIDRWFNPPAQPFAATQSVIILKSIADLQSDPEKQEVSDRRSTPYTPPASSVWSRLAQALDTVLTLTESNILRHASDGPLTIGAYNKIHFGGLGRSMPKGESYRRTLFRRGKPAPPGPPSPPPALQQPPSPHVPGLPYPCALIDDGVALPSPALSRFETLCEHRKLLFRKVEWGPPPPPVVQHLRNPCRQILAYPQTFIDDGFALPPPAFSGPTTTWEQTSEQPATEEEMLPEKPVWIKGSWLLQRPNGRTPVELAGSTPETILCASAATREARKAECESSTPVDEGRDKRVVIRDNRRILVLKSWRKK
jgi:hypothetical protein